MTKKTPSVWFSKDNISSFQRKIKKDQQFIINIQMTLFHVDSVRGFPIKSNSLQVIPYLL